MQVEIKVIKDLFLDQSLSYRIQKGQYIGFYRVV